MKKLFILIPFVIGCIITNAQTSTYSEIRNDVNELKRLLILRNNYQTTGVAGSRLGFGTFRDVDANNLGAAIDAINTPGATFGNLSHGAKLIFSTAADGGWGVEPRMSILNTGEVGIATLTPQAKFQVKGNANFSSTTTLGTTTIGGANDFGLYYEDRGNTWTQVAVHNQGSGIMLYANPQGAEYYGMWQSKYSPSSAGLMSNPNYPLVLGAGSEAVRITPNGNVGFGTANPQSKLDLRGVLQVSEDLNNFYGLRVLTPVRIPTGYSIGRDVDFQVVTYNNNAVTALTIQSQSGNVGIGTTNPQAKLAVKGTILAQKVKVSVLQQDWPDYVFEPTYNLRSLSSLETYLNKNKHLPDVPSAEEIGKGGLDLASVQASLLKKIEELTLYVIKQEKENKKLKQRVDLLQSNQKKN